MRDLNTVVILKAKFKYLLHFFSFLEQTCQLHYDLFNFTQHSTYNAKNEYKYLTVFVLQKTGLTGFNLQTPHIAENAWFSEGKKPEQEPNCTLKSNRVSRVKSPQQQ